MASSTSAPTFSITRSDRDDGTVVLRLSGRLGFADIVAFWEGLRNELRLRAARGAILFDLSGVRQADSSTLALLVQLVVELEADGQPAEIVGAEGRVADILQLYQTRSKPISVRAPSGPGLLGRTGKATAELLGEVRQTLSFVGAFVISQFGILIRPRTANWKDVSPIAERAGADGLPIVLLINFLVGLIMGFQGAVQLKQFGANIFVADLVGLTVTRELGPLMTAIIVCGRSGAAFAAELGTMKVNEEIDALRTMGFDPHRFLVFPRALALVLVMPLLTLLADTIAVMGGAMVGVLGLDLTVSGYLVRTQHALDAIDVFSGLVKSLAFGFLIAVIACQQGLSASGGAQGVGRRTTSSVVATLFALIVADAAFTVIMTVFGI